ncbi:MAG: hypothetical protein D6680_07250 [Cyanobacteria bacterium J007]|nr:MAG: hypothetical protein D6680_07250 [Cyanobacteria bacterium J007]
MLRKIIRCFEGGRSGSTAPLQTLVLGRLEAIGSSRGHRQNGKNLPGLSLGNYVIVEAISVTFRR